MYVSYAAGLSDSFWIETADITEIKMSNNRFGDAISKMD